MSRRSPLTASLDFPDTAPGALPGARLRLRFEQPLAVIEAWSLDQVRPAIEQVQAHAAAGRWCVGGLAYETAPAFDPALPVRPADPRWPLVWFGVYDAPSEAPAAQPPAAAPVDWRMDWDRPRYLKQADTARQAMAAGECYQINLTTALQGALGGDPAGWMDALQHHQGSGYLLRLGDGERQVLSASPELFFDWQPGPQGGRLCCRPMKGTAARESDPVLDRAAREALQASDKERAENVMIVDLLRNDLSRIAQPHSVQVPVLFATQKLPTVWQMTSDVVARTRPGTTLMDVFAALFPCGSVTGAPKVRAMQMIHALEGAPRGVYCGAVGVVRPHGAAGPDGLHCVAATFNVPIRTVVLQGRGAGAWAAHCGIGSGITSDAETGAEWREWATKRAFVERASMPFEILETLALRDGRLQHADSHLQRMGEAAVHFGYPWNPHAARQELQIAVLQHMHGAWRVRLLLAADGSSRAEAFALHPTDEPVRLRLADQPFEAAHSEFVRYKTTRRAHYAAFAPEPGSGVFDTVLWNEAGEITEGTFGNIAALVDGRWVTPPLSSGLLPGVGRALALREGRVVEAVLRVDDVPRVEAWAFVNSLRGWLAAELEADAPEVG